MMKKNKENKERKPFFFGTKENGVCKQVEIRHKGILSAILLIIVILLLGLFGMTGCKKKTTDNGKTNTTTKTTKVYTFEEVFKFREGISDSGEIYPYVIKNIADESNNIKKNYIFWTANYKVKIKKISYTIANTSTSDKWVYRIYDNKNYYSSSNDTWKVYETLEGYEKITLAPNETLNVVATYDNFIVNKGQHWAMTFLKYSEYANFYNFKVEFEVIE